MLPDVILEIEDEITRKKTALKIKKRPYLMEFLETLS